MGGRSGVTVGQSFLELGCISGGALGLPAMVVGGQLAAQYGAGTAVIAVCIGNLLLWLLGLGILSMTESKHHAIDNVRGYLGATTSFFAALVWILAFIMWYAIQIDGATSVLERVFPEISGWKIGLLLGGFVAALSYGGIALITRISCILLPLLVCLSIYFIATNNRIDDFEGNWDVSIYAIMSVILVWLPGIVNLPTIFRHARSRSHAILGLCIMSFLHVFFQVFTILIGADRTVRIVDQYLSVGGFSFGLGAAICFAVFSLLSINLVNIYFASAGWEAAVFKHKYPAQYVFVGLVGTGSYLFYHRISAIFVSMSILEAVLTGFIASLGVVLIVDFLIRLIVQHRPRPLEKMWSSVCWLIGCGAFVIAYMRNPSESGGILQIGVSPIIFSINATMLSFLIILFFEESIWALRKIQGKTNSF